MMAISPEDRIRQIASLPKRTQPIDPIQSEIDAINTARGN
jgi:hypothetical protein